MKINEIAKATIRISVGIYLLFYWAAYQNIISGTILRIPEILIFLSFTIIILKNKPRVNKHNWGMRISFYLFIFIFIISGLYNNIGLAYFFLFFKSIIVFILIYFILLNSDLAIREVRKLYHFVGFIFLIQIPIALIKLFIFGSNETPLGFIGSQLTTYFVLMAVTYYFTEYLFIYKKRNLILILLFFLVGIVGGKRSLAFFVPIVLLITYILFIIIKRNIGVNFFLLISILLLSFYIFIRTLPTLNPDNKVWGEFNAEYALQYAKDYSYGEYKQSDMSLYAIGRSSAIENTLKKMNEYPIIQQLIGIGPGSIIKTSVKKLDNREVITTEFGVLYGTNGFIFFLVQTGWLGLLSFLSFNLSFIWIYVKNLRRKELIDEDKSILIVAIAFTFILTVLGFYYDVVHKVGPIIVIIYTIQSLGLIIIQNNNATNQKST